MQLAFRVLVRLERRRIAGELISPEPGLLVNDQPLQLVQLSGNAVGMVDAALFPQRALDLPGQHQGKEQQQDQREEHGRDQNHAGTGGDSTRAPSTLRGIGLQQVLQFVDQGERTVPFRGRDADHPHHLFGKGHIG